MSFSIVFRVLCLRCMSNLEGNTGKIFSLASNWTVKLMRIRIIRIGSTMPPVPASKSLGFQSDMVLINGR